MEHDLESALARAGDAVGARSQTSARLHGLARSPVPDEVVVQHAHRASARRCCLDLRGSRRVTGRFATARTGAAQDVDHPHIRQCVLVPHESLRGRRTLLDGRFVADDAQREIDRRLKSMRLLADIGDGVPSFYLDATGRYWMYSEYEDYESTLEPVERSRIEREFPSVDPDRPL